MKRHLRSLCVFSLFLLGGLALGFALPRVSAWLKPAYVEGDYSSYLSGAKSGVVLYSTSWCPYCAKAKAYFAEHKIAYTEMDIEQSPVARQQYEQLGGGSIPKVLIGNRMIIGFIPSAFDAALAKVAAAK
jgi:mycoredoxin